MRAGRDEHAGRLPQAGHQLLRGDRLRIAHEDDRAGLRRDVGQPRRGRGDPVADDRVVVGDAALGASEQPHPPVGGQGQTGQAVAQGGRGYRGEVAPAPQLLAQGGRGQRPADAQAGQPVGLREPAGDDHPLVAAPGRRGQPAVALGPSVDLVREHPRAVPRRDGAHCVDLVRGQARAGRVVRVAQDHEPGPLRDQGAELVEIGCPARSVAVAREAQGPGADARAAGSGQEVRLQVVRMLHDDFVAGVHEAPAGDEVRLRAAVRDQHVGDRRPRVAGRDELPQRDGAVRLRVAERLAEQATDLVRRQQLPETEGLYAALREVDFDLMLVERLQSLEGERLDGHSVRS